jgi:tetratricopeptide (TPR) repeat protein
VELNPDLADAHYVLAFVYGDLGDMERAGAASRRATTLNPSYAKAQTNLSLDRYSTARYQELVGDRVRRPEVAAGEVLAHYNLGIAFRQKGLYEEALREFGARWRRARSRRWRARRSPRCTCWRGRRRRRWTCTSGCWPRTRGAPSSGTSAASACTRRATSPPPRPATPRAGGGRGYALAWNNLGVVRLHRGDADGAEEAFREAVTLGPGFTDAWCNRGLMYLRRGRHGAALDAYRAALRASPDAAGAWNGIGAVLMETRRYEEARNAFVRAVETDPTTPRRATTSRSSSPTWATSRARCARPSARWS